jgi:phosphohistidine phosphatase SixA
MRSRFCKTVLVLAVSSISLLQSDNSNAQTSGPSDLPALIVFVRHAEFESEPKDDPHLNAAGIKRAQDLAAALRDTKFSAIITSQLLRTRETAQLIAAALGLSPEVVPLDTKNPSGYREGVVAALRKHAGGSVLVVSHSRSGPPIIAALGGPRLPAMCESVYDDLFVLVPTAGKMQLVQSRYGAVSQTRGPDCK